MYTVKYKNCIAQQNHKTYAVTVSKDGNNPMTHEYSKKLSVKEMRALINRYIEKEMK